MAPDCSPETLQVIERYSTSGDANPRRLPRSSNNQAFYSRHPSPEPLIARFFYTPLLRQLASHLDPGFYAGRGSIRKSAHGTRQPWAKCYWRQIRSQTGELKVGRDLLGAPSNTTNSFWNVSLLIESHEPGLRSGSGQTSLFPEQQHEEPRTQSRTCLGSLLCGDGVSRYRGKSHANIPDYPPGGSWREGRAD